MGSIRATSSPVYIYYGLRFAIRLPRTTVNFNVGLPMVIVRKDENSCFNGMYSLKESSGGLKARLLFAHETQTHLVPKHKFQVMLCG